MCCHLLYFTCLENSAELERAPLCTLECFTCGKLGLAQARAPQFPPLKAREAVVGEGSNAPDRIRSRSSSRGNSGCLSRPYLRPLKRSPSQRPPLARLHAPPPQSHPPSNKTRHESKACRFTRRYLKRRCFIFKTRSSVAAMQVHRATLLGTGERVVVKVNVLPSLQK